MAQGPSASSQNYLKMQQMIEQLESQGRFSKAAQMRAHLVNWSAGATCSGSLCCDDTMEVIQSAVNDMSEDSMPGHMDD